MNYCLTKKRSGRNILNGHVNLQYGDTCKSSFQLSSIELGFKKLNRWSIYWLDDLYSMVKNLEDMLIRWSFDQVEAYIALYEFWDGASKIEKWEKELEERQLTDEEFNNNFQEIKETFGFHKNFILEYSIKVLRRFLETNLSLPFNTRRKLLTVTYVELLDTVLEILLKIFNQFNYLPKKYAGDKSFFNCVLKYMNYKETWIHAYRVLQCFIYAHKNIR